jgi:hypothetical protein
MFSSIVHREIGPGLRLTLLLLRLLLLLILLLILILLLLLVVVFVVVIITNLITRCRGSHLLLFVSRQCIKDAEGLVLGQW